MIVTKSRELNEKKIGAALIECAYGVFEHRKRAYGQDGLSGKVHSRRIRRQLREGGRPDPVIASTRWGGKLKLTALAVPNYIRHAIRLSFA